MILKEALKQGIGILKNSNIETPAVDAGVILCSVLNCDKTFLYAHDEYIINESQLRDFLRLLESRAKGMPVQYITEHQEFMSLNFYISPDVLIPRQDTEILVESLIEYSKEQKKKTLEILDIGTGSGCIAVSLAHYIEGCKVVAVDVSEKALNTASKNAFNNGVLCRVEFVNSNLFENVSSNASFDIIVSNPPYIESEEIKKLQVEVKEFEPTLALDGGIDGLDFYREIIQKAPRFQKEGGILAFEVGYNQAEEVANLMRESYLDIKIIKDYSKIGRVVVGRLANI